MPDISKKFATYDTKTDNLYIAVRGGIRDNTVELVPGITIEVNNAGDMIGIEIRKVSRLFSGEQSTGPAAVRPGRKKTRTRRTTSRKT